MPDQTSNPTLGQHVGYRQPQTLNHIVIMRSLCAIVAPSTDQIDGFVEFDALCEASSPTNEELGLRRKPTFAV